MSEGLRCQAQLDDGRTCLASTREGKAYCPTHVLQSSYAARVSAEHELLRDLARQMGRGEKPDPYGLLADELVHQLADDPELGAAARPLMLNPHHLMRLARACARAGRIHIYPAVGRGMPIARPTQPQPAQPGAAAG